MPYRQEAPVSVYAAVFEAVDASVARRRSMPWAEACVQGALAHFRRSAADPEAVRHLETISIRLHQLTGSRSDAAAAELKTLAHDWMANAPMH